MEIVNSILDQMMELCQKFFNLCYDGHITKVGIITIVVLAIGLFSAFTPKGDSNGNAFMKVLVAVVVIAVIFACIGVHFMGQAGWHV